MKFIDVRSDTVTMPTEKMRQAMANAEVGDDVYEDDPTVKRLEALAAEVTGKEAGLFVPTGTFGNQLALFTHCERGNEIIAGENCHIIAHEAGAAAIIAGVITREVPTVNGFMDPAKIEAKIRKAEDIHYPKTGLITIENAQSDGTVMTLENLEEIKALAERYQIPVHMDGARVFNAAISLGCHVSEVTKYADSVMFCVSKGLCAPVGSLVVGSRAFIEKARRKRKIMGGGMRQAGVLAAAAMVAIEDMVSHLATDHENARKLAEGLEQIPRINVQKEKLMINMVYFTIDDLKNEELLVNKMLERGIKMNGSEDNVFRMVTNYDVSAQDVETIILSIDAVLNEYC